MCAKSALLVVFEVEFLDIVVVASVKEYKPAAISDWVDSIALAAEDRAFVAGRNLSVAAHSHLVAAFVEANIDLVEDIALLFSFNQFLYQAVW
jgi:hypothetical protein